MNLKVQAVTFSYNSTPVLDNITFELQPREIVALVGPNGSGKSTLLKCIDRILRPQHGKISIDSQDIRRMSQQEISKKLGYVPQRVISAFPLSVFETVLMGRRPHIAWRTSQKDIDAVLKSISLLELEHLAMRDFAELSGGEMQRVLLARAVAQEAGILLLDEPTSNLDIRHQIEAMEILRQLVTVKNISAIVAVHDLNLAARYADRMIMLSGGRICATGSPSEVLTADGISKSYGIRVTVRNENGRPFIIPLGIDTGSVPVA